MDKIINKIIEHYNFSRMPVEGTYMIRTYRCSQNNANGEPMGTAMMGLYCDELESLSCFHKLDRDEMWHFYGGDPISLYLLHENGTTQEITLGSNFEKGEQVQFLIPAGVWQGACIKDGGSYSLFGCTVCPGFVGTCFEAGISSQLINKYPNMKDVILKLGINGDVTKMPDGYAK